MIGETICEIGVNNMEYMELMRKRHSVRQYTDKMIESENRAFHTKISQSQNFAITAMICQNGF